VRGVPAEQRAEAVARYVAGERSGKIGADYGVTDQAVRLWARQAGVPIHPRGYDPRRTDDDTRAPAIAAYAAGESSVAVAARCGVSSSSITHWARQAGIEVHRSGRSAAASVEVRELILKRYAAGESTIALAREFAVSKTAILRWAHLTGTPLPERDTNPGWINKSHPLAVRKAAVDAFVAGESSIVVARRFGVHPKTVRWWATKTGYRRAGASSRAAFTAEVKLEVAAAYAAGEPSWEIAERFGCSTPSIRAWAKAAGVPFQKRRRRGRSGPPRSALPVTDDVRVMWIEEIIAATIVGPVPYGCTTPCLVSIGVQPDEYGTTRGGLPAHRVMWELHVGRVSTRLVIDHRCREKRCVNPHHLEPVSSGENVRRATAGYRADKAGELWVPPVRTYPAGGVPAMPDWWFERSVAA
jgi:transposase-like protein